MVIKAPPVELPNSRKVLDDIFIGPPAF
jgi:hypothetical protein